MESSDIQSAVARTQHAGRMQQQAAEQEELRRKRFELERARELAETSKKIQEAQESAERRKVEDRWDGAQGKRQEKGDGTPGEAGGTNEDGGSAHPTGSAEGGIDVRV